MISRQLQKLSGRLWRSDSPAIPRWKPWLWTLHRPGVRRRAASTGFERRNPAIGDRQARRAATLVNPRVRTSKSPFKPSYYV